MEPTRRRAQGSSNGRSITTPSSSSAAIVFGLPTFLSGMTAPSSSASAVNTTDFAVGGGDGGVQSRLLPPVPIWLQPAALRPHRRTRSRPRAKTSSERGQLFRQRQKLYVDSLEESIRQLREQIAQLSASVGLSRERAFASRTTDWGSLVQVSRELFTVLRHGLKMLDPVQHGVHETRAAELMRTSIQTKENFLRRVADPDVMYGSLVGADALVDQWHKHTACYSKFEIDVGRAECITDDPDANPVVMLCFTLNAQFSRETVLVMFPSAWRRPHLMDKFVDRDLTFNCVAWFEFSGVGQILTYNVQVNYIEALVMAVGSARDVAEFMELSVVMPDTVLVAVEPDTLEWEKEEEEKDAFASFSGAHSDYGIAKAGIQTLDIRGCSRSMDSYERPSDSSESETKGDERSYYFNLYAGDEQRHPSDRYHAPLPSMLPPLSTPRFYDADGYEDGEEGCDGVVQV